MQLVGHNISGAEADRRGIVSHSVPAPELEAVTIGIAREIASRHLAPLEHAKIAVQVERDLSLSQAVQLDQWSAPGCGKAWIRPRISRATSIRRSALLTASASGRMFEKVMSVSGSYEIRSSIYMTISNDASPHGSC
jgi:hypothetical protein